MTTTVKTASELSAELRADIVEMERLQEEYRQAYLRVEAKRREVFRAADRERGVA